MDEKIDFILDMLKVATSGITVDEVVEIADKKYGIVRSKNKNQINFAEGG